MEAVSLFNLWEIAPVLGVKNAGFVLEIDERHGYRNGKSGQVFGFAAGDGRNRPCTAGQADKGRNQEVPGRAGAYGKKYAGGISLSWGKPDCSRRI